jgi:hypothetical protein
MASRILEFSPQTLLDLFTHYTQGEVPLGATLLDWGTHPILNRQIGFLISSEHWGDSAIPESDLVDKSQRGGIAPLQLRYEGKKVLTWSKSTGGEPLWDLAENFRDQRGDK